MSEVRVGRGTLLESVNGVGGEQLAGVSASGCGSSSYRIDESAGPDRQTGAQRQSNPDAVSDGTYLDLVHFSLALNR